MLVVNVLMHPLDSFAPVHCKALLVNTEFLTAINNFDSIAQLIVRTLTNVIIEFNNVLATVSDNSDNATYMKSASRMAYVECCLTQYIHLVGDEFHDALNMCELPVATMKSIFSKMPGRRSRYLQHLKENNVSNACMPSSPVVTRWNTWFAAVVYHANHIDHYASFVEKEIEHCTTLQLRKAAELLHGNRLAMLRVELEFVTVHCEHLVSTLL